MSKKYAIFITALFCVFISAFLVAGAVAPDKAFSDQENRALQQLPVPTFGENGNFFSGEFMTDFETYTNDQFVLRDRWIGMKSAAELAIGKQENNDVYVCKGDTLMTRFDQPDQARVDKNTEYLNKFVANAGVPVYFSLIPGQATIWADRLPAGAPNADQKAIIDGIAAKTTAQYFDTYSALWDHKSEDIYYRTDHHWTSLGAYYGYTAFMKGLGMEPLPLSTYQKTTVSDAFYGTTFSSSGVKNIRPDSIDMYVPDPGVQVTSWFSEQPEPGKLYDWARLEKKDKYPFFMGGNQSLAVIKNPQVQGPKILILRDSYTDSLVPFLTAHFSEIHLFDLRYNRNSVPQYIKNNGIDMAVMLYSVPNYVTDANFFTLRQK
ncbi:MAG: DHHW family protein [Pseudoflavonifractor sp.]